VGEHPNGTSVTHTTADGIPAGDRPPAPAWRSWAVGTRVVVRRRLPEGHLGDVLGDLLEVGPDGVVVDTRRGPVPVAAADIVLGKPVPPPPARRAPRTGPGTGPAGGTGPADVTPPGPADA
jgi:hypothetical protein